MRVPDSIKYMKPSGFGPVEVRDIQGHYYVYMVSSKKPPGGGRWKKVTGKCIGQVTEADGFVPNANALHILARSPDSYSIYAYGAYETLSSLAAGMEENVRRHFRDDFAALKVCSLIDVVHRTQSPELVDCFYRQSFLCVQYPGLVFSEGSIKRIHDLNLSSGPPYNGDPGVVQYMKQAYLDALADKINRTGFVDACPVDCMIEVLNTIYMIRAPMLKSYLLSPVPGIAQRFLDAANVALEKNIVI